MMKCIQAAIDQGHIGHEEGRQLQDEVDKLLRLGLSPDKLRGRLFEDLDRAAKDRRRRALLQEARRKVLTEALLEHRNARGENDPAEALRLLVERQMGEAANFQDAEYLRLSVMAGAHAELAGLLHEFRKGWLTGDLRRKEATFAGVTVGGNAEVTARMDNIVRELFGRDTGDAKAKALSQSWMSVVEKLRQRYNAAGGSIGKLDYGYLPQSHDPEALLAIGRDAWVDYLMRPGVLNRDKMVSTVTGERIPDDELREALANAWQAITSEGWINRDPSFRPFGKGALAKQRDDFHRFIHFADADQFLAYMRDFKAGDPFDAMMKHVTLMSRDIATLETFGPNPEAMRNYLKQLVQQHAAEARPIQRVIKDEKARLSKIVGNILPGDVGERFVARIEGALNDLADAELRLKAKGGADAELEAASRSARAKLDAIEKDMEHLEPSRIGQRRADLGAELEAVQRDMRDIRNSPNPGTRGGLTKRDRAKLSELGEREFDLKRQIDELNSADTSILREEPAAYQDIIDAMDGIRAEASRIRAGGYRAVADPVEHAKKQLLVHDQMWDMFRGTHFAPVSTKWANGLQVTRNLGTAAWMGTAFWTSLADIPAQRIARRLAGMDYSYFTVIRDTLTMLSHANRQELLASRMVLDSAIHVLHRQAEYVGGVNKIGLSQFLADRVLQFSLLTPWTEMGKFGLSMAIQRTHADHVHLGFEALPKLMQRNLLESGISAAEWDMMRQAKLYQPRADAGGWLRPNEIAAGPGGEALANKYTAMMLRTVRMGIIEGTVRSRTFLGGGRPGTLLGEMGRTAGQFKGFPIAFTLLHLGYIKREWQRGERMNAASLASMLLVSHAMVGMVINDIYDMLNGRKPRMLTRLINGKGPDEKTWADAITGRLPTPDMVMHGELKAGGLGVVGDALFAPAAGPTPGLSGWALGPIGSEIERVRQRMRGDVIDLYDGSTKEGRFARNAIRTLDEIMPGSSLWQFRLLKDRLILNNLQRWLDPSAERVWHRQEQILNKDGKQFWWRPGDSSPGASPPYGSGASRAVQPPTAAGSMPVGEKIVQTPEMQFSVVDGDTIVARGHRWRIEGYDAPEVYSHAKTNAERVAGVRASVRLEQLLRSGRAELTVSNPPDHWGRGRARVTIDGKDVADTMRREGHVKRP